ncbi:glycosyltransferase family 1 protein [Massilia sp. CFBP 13647]|uniref:glycosyltransferase family 4 protein n=1 Tax=Massilia sp. CFBP 13647 TaxID=2775276 RepID=UPI00177C41C0|nr:glycosyltransferase family 1 protein [Massilia sp. CFBP 13647]MBD8529894.1 glycosyltransferase family 4 protein [Massilia sp. CFBP 13647]
MRIVLDLQACQASSMQRGIGRYSMALALAMARNPAGHDLRIVLNDAYPDSVAAIRQAFDSLLPQSHITTFAVPLPASEADPRNRWRLHSAERIREHYLAGLRPDVVHVASLFEGLGDNAITSVPHDEGRFASAVTLYDLIPLVYKERYLGDPSVAAWYRRKLENIKRADLLLAISGSARREGAELLGLPPERIVNISSAVDARFHPRVLAPQARSALLARLGLRREFIMYTGGIDYRKNIEGLIEAYAGLAPPLRRQYQLAVVCSVQAPERVRLERLAAKRGLAQDELVLTGFVSDDDLVALYNCTALFVFPSLHEGFGLPVLEAMACGAAVIGSNTSSIPEVIGRADALFDPARIGDIGAAMAAVLADPARQASLRAHGLAQAARFSWEASARRAIEAFEEAHARHPRTHATRVAAGGAAPARPRLAWVVPAVPARSPAGLLAALAQYYDIELVPAQEGAWFEANADGFERIVYQVGNVAGLAPLLDLLERHPGMVVLDDFFLGQAISDAEAGQGPAGRYYRALYLAHGYAALAEEKDTGRAASCLAYPCNKTVLDRATGVIVPAADMLAQATHWYGAACAAGWRVLAPAAAPAHAAALYHDAIEAAAHEGARAAERRLLAAIAALGSAVPEADLLQTAAAIAANRPRGGARQVLVDVGQPPAPAEEALLRALLTQAPPGWRIEPVRHDGSRYCYARRFTLGLIGRADLELDDAVADAGAGDAWLTLVPDGAAAPAAWLARGVVACSFDAGANVDGAAGLLAAALDRAGRA